MTAKGLQLAHQFVETVSEALEISPQATAFDRHGIAADGERSLEPVDDHVEVVHQALELAGALFEGGHGSQSITR